jgi:NAD(P)-dependent dehydrogenase (short-subunit alcohol dehydrogenase family)
MNILVVGGSSGIGEHLINTLIDTHDLNEVTITNLDINKKEFNGYIYYHHIDLNDDKSIDNTLFELLGIEFDKVFYCAGISEVPTKVLKKDSEVINKLVNTNSSALVKILSNIDISPGASIVITSSSHSLRAAGVNPIYSGTKGFIDSFVRSYSKTLIEESYENGTELIRINSVNPEMVNTPMITNLFVGKEDELTPVINSRIMKRLLDPSEVVKPMLFLASESASGITGINLPIGGMI